MSSYAAAFLQVRDLVQGHEPRAGWRNYCTLCASMAAHLIAGTYR